MIKHSYFNNNFKKITNNVYILDEEDLHVSNFGKQWKRYNLTQIDSVNNFNISKNFLKELLFSDLKILKNMNVIEIGSGSGRFTEHIVSYAKKCVSIDMSEAIFYNYSSKACNLSLIKADFNKLDPKNKFDIVICRGVLQHTANPLLSLKKIHEFVKKDGFVFFDIYKMPKIGKLHPKYLIWRPLIQKLFTYEKTEIFLSKNIKLLLSIKRFLKKIFFNSNFISDCIIPIWDYHGTLKLNNTQLEEWAILDTLDGLYAYYDNPKKFNEIVDFLNKENIYIKKSNKTNNFFQTSLKK